MTVVDERSRVPALDAAAIRRLAAALDRPELIAAFLIGSQARGTAGPLSDVDIAVIHAPTLAPQDLPDLRLSLAAAAGVALGTSEVDVVLLNGAPALMRHEALRDPVVLVDHDPQARIDFQVRALGDYLDTEPMRTLFSRHMHERIREGRLAVPPRIDARLERLEALLGQLEGFRARGRAAYVGEPEVRLATQHALQLAIQICIDVAAYLLATAGRSAPDRYQDLFTDLRAEGLDERLATGLAQAASLRNILVHDYLEADD
ncbi:MAG TPA: HepT-like ribonuclease domain-containing protein, partial [Solirubrobacterales bacterium]|nr:HepT-like ribonuclease domain-containing protein [Solirubrobacterales bacterium]